MTENNTTTSSDSRLRAVPVQPIEISDGVLLVRGNMAVKLSGRGGRSRSDCPDRGRGRGGDAAGTHQPLRRLDRPGAEELVKILAARACSSPATRSRCPPRTVRPRRRSSTGSSASEADQVAARLARAVSPSSVSIASPASSSGPFPTAASRGWPLWTIPCCAPTPFPVTPSRPKGGPAGTGAFRAMGTALDEGLDCVVATADFSGQQLLRHWNSWCVNRGCTFLPVMLDKGIGCVGPLVVPGETACYECLRARENSNLEDPETRRAAENLVAVVRRSDSMVSSHPWPRSWATSPPWN